MYSNGFLSQGFVDRREVLHGGSTTSRTGLLPFWGITTGMAEFWASTGGCMAGYIPMLLAKTLVLLLLTVTIIGY